jgi:hypothetical protein
MTDTTAPVPGAADAPITLDEIRNKALRIRDEVKDEVTGQVELRRNQLVAAGVVAVVLIVGVAYLVGSRAGRRATEPRRY